MKERLGKLLEFCLDEGRRHYDPEAGLIGDFDPRFYTEKMLAEHYYNRHWGGFQCKRGTVFFVLY